MGKPAFERKFTDDFIIDLIKKNQPISLYQIAKKLGYSYSGTKYYIISLINKGKLMSELKLNEETNRAERLIWLK